MWYAILIGTVFAAGILTGFVVFYFWFPWRQISELTPNPEVMASLDPQLQKALGEHAARLRAEH